MGWLRFFVLCLVWAPSLGLAQAARSPENVTVTGTKSREVLQDFVRSFAAPTRLTGKMARWESGVCPITVGLRPQFTDFISQRVKDIAKQAGAPVNDRAPCAPNIVIVFSGAPQKLLDDIRQKQPNLLGYYDNSAQLAALAAITHPIQAWYMTATRDVQGSVQVDNARPAGLGVRMEVPCDICTPPYIVLYTPRAVTTTGSRLGDGLRSELYKVIIVADRDKLASYEMGPLADYIAMLALSQVTSLDSCRQLPSIVNMLAEGCERKTGTLTENDKAYLHGLYKATSDQSLGIQQDQMAYQMEQELKGR